MTICPICQREPSGPTYEERACLACTDAVTWCLLNGYENGSPRLRHFLEEVFVAARVKLFADSVSPDQMRLV